MDEQDKKADETSSSEPPKVAAFYVAPAASTEVSEDETTRGQATEGEKHRNRYAKLMDKPKEIGFDRIVELALTCAIVYFAWSQVRVAETSSEGSTRQLGQIIVAADRINDAADSFSRSSADIGRATADAVNKLNLQAVATNKAADAARSAAQTAKETLHVSERAYVVIEDTSFGFSTKSVILPLVNSGHIPSGEMISVVHEATYNVASPADQINYNIPNQIDWQHQRWDSILQGNHQTLIIPIPPLEEDRVNAGTQMVVVAGSLTYNDGFVGSSQQKWKFCFRNWYQTVMKRAYLSPCNPEQILPYLEKADGYPNNEHPN